MSLHDDSVIDAQMVGQQDLAASSVTGIRPVTIRQLVEATRPHSDAPFSIDGILVDRVSTVARVLGFGKISSSITYTLEDGTCRGISARQWLSDGGDTLSEDYRGYVHVVGQLDTRTQSRFKNVLVVKTIRALGDDPADQLAFHILQAAYVTLCLERGPPPKSVRSREAPRCASIGSNELPPSRIIPKTPSRAGTSKDAQVDSPNPKSPATPSPIRERAQPRLAAQATGARESVRPAEPARLEQPSLSDEDEVPSREASPSPIRPLTPVSPRPSSYVTKRNLPAQGPSGGSRRKSEIKRDPYAHLTVLQRAILLQILNTQSAGTGSDVFTISKGVVHHNPTVEEIGDALDLLVNDGFIETTIDPSHYAIRTSHYPTSP